MVTYWKEYLKRAKLLRKSETKQFVNFIKPYKQVSRELISRWIRLVMEAAGVDTNIYKPRSTRIATTKANAACVLVHEILRTSRWSTSTRCFDMFYSEPVEQCSFASAILQID